MEAMKPSLYIDSSGVIRYIENCPEHPHEYLHHSDQYAQGAYETALQAAKDSAIEIQNQEQAKAMCNGWYFSCCPMKHSFKYGCLMLDTTHPIPKGWTVEVMDSCLKCGLPNRCKMITCEAKKLAVLTPQKPDQLKDINVTQSEEQESFWKRLIMFVENVQVNDPMSEEEKEMILNVAKGKLPYNS